MDDDQPLADDVPFADLWAFAAESGDDAGRLALLRGADLAVPASADGSAPWPVVHHEGHDWVTVWTSPAAMAAAMGAAGPDGPWQVASFVELVLHWPDVRWGLAVDLGTPYPLLLEPGTVSRLLAPDLDAEQAAAPDQVVWVQQLVPLAGLDPLLREPGTRVSGHLQRTADLEHVGAPTVLLRALGRSDEELALVTDEGSVHLLRWPALGAALYRVPRATMGLGPGRTTPVREYRVDQVALPHGAALVELDRHGAETQRARYDALHGRWRLVVPAPARGSA
ncbi:SseB protein N-terminal domain-containing protein [Klenkia soli]|uniref:SseB protein N-terminal domain-containing protein n=1 Tax=Klenkia soli TaxID=1052260 RepID=A0A1H0TGL8_9ACTN|nr:hypothetical protein [Klenkia soli]SDP52810.1 SseB protein N-terminal domain-containing protein [Klenkia soli]